MPDDTTTTNTTSDNTATGAEQALRTQVARSKQQVLELETAMEGMLRDHDTIQEDLDHTRALIGGVRSDLQLALRAIGRIEAGTYGKCVDCGNPIAPARLEAIPEAERCANCA